MLQDDASISSVCIGLPTAAQIQAAMTSPEATAPYSPEACADMLAGYGGNFEEVGNGLCNPGVHNTPVCNYDGGDCCISTCVPQVTQSFTTAIRQSGSQLIFVLLPFGVLST